MADEILDRIWKAREELLKKHGGFDGLLEYVRKLERAQKARLARKKKKLARKKAPAAP